MHVVVLNGAVEELSSNYVVTNPTKLNYVAATNKLHQLEDQMEASSTQVMS